MVTLLGIGMAAAMSMTSPTIDTDRGKFAYPIEKTPEEGPIDPAVANRYSKAWQDCQTQASEASARDRCFQREFARQNAALNRTWSQTLHRLAHAKQPALIGAQRRWIAARDPFCRTFVAGMRGTLASTAYLDCRVELTIRRTIWLEKL